MDKTAQDNYIPFGKEWKKEVSQFPKAAFIDLVSKWMTDNKDKIASLSYEIEQLRQQLAEAKNPLTLSPIDRTAKDVLKEFYEHYKNVVFPEKNWVDWDDSDDYGSVKMIVAAMESYASLLTADLTRQLEEAKKEVERLKGLVERTHTTGWNHAASDKFSFWETSWGNFKQSHNL